METGELKAQLNQLGREIDNFSSTEINTFQVDQLKLRYQVFKNHFEQHLTNTALSLPYPYTSTEIKDAHILVANVSHENSYTAKRYYWLC